MKRKQNLYTKTNELRHEAESIQWYLDNFQKIAPTEQEEYLEITSFERSYRDIPIPVDFRLISTTHSHPVDQTSTGWDKHHIYELGWAGNFRFKGKHDWFISFTGKPEAFYTGSGGGGHQEFRMYIKDFPKLYKILSEEMSEGIIPKICKLHQSALLEDRLLAEEIFLAKVPYCKEFLDKFMYNQICVSIPIHSILNIYHAWIKYWEQPIRFETHKIIPDRNVK